MKLHAGIILDGNRRFARKLGIKAWKGHEFGAEKVEKLFDWAKELDIGELTLYCFSLDNFKRDKEEVEYLINIFKKWFRRFRNDKRINEDNIRIVFLGDLKRFDDELQMIMQEISEKTKNYKKFRINFLMGYDGRQEILNAVQKIIDNNGAINEDNITKNLSVGEPDFIIRTGGEIRTSGFLPWQTIYSEWFFLDKLWPEIEKEDLEKCINEFKKRGRRFGQ